MDGTIEGKVAKQRNTWCDYLDRGPCRRGLYSRLKPLDNGQQEPRKNSYNSKIALYTAGLGDVAGTHTIYAEARVAVLLFSTKLRS